MRRLLPAATLMLLAPFIAEFVLGNLPATRIGLLLPLALMYGSGALLVRELIRRFDLPPLSLMMMALAYGLVEEGLVTQSLFDPGYAGQRLLDYGFLPALGTALPWVLYVLTLHVVWSIIVPIAGTELLFRSRAPWIGQKWIALVAAIYVAGSLSLHFATSDGFEATFWQSAIVAVISAALVMGAFRLRKAPRAAALRLHPVALFAVSLSAGSLFMMVQMMAERSWHLPWQTTAGIQIAVIGSAAIATILLGGRRWSSGQRMAGIAGGVAVYLWFGVVLDRAINGEAMAVHLSLVVAGFAAVGLVALLARRWLPVEPSPVA